MRKLRPVLAATVALILGGQTISAEPAYPHAREPIGSVRAMYDGTLTPELAVQTFRNIDRLFPTRTVHHGSVVRPLPPARRRLSDVRFSGQGEDVSLERLLDGNRISGLLVLHHGEIALERYRYGNTERTRWMSMSVAKSITSTLIGAAVAEGRIASISDPVTKYSPVLRGSAYEGVPIRDVLMMASGVQWDETYTDPSSDRRRLLEAQISQVPGSAMHVMTSLQRGGPPGTVFNYSTGETQVAAQVLHDAMNAPLADYLSHRIWMPFGMEADATWWLDSKGGVEIGGSGFSAVLRDYGRFGQFILEGGVAGKTSILPHGWIGEATTPKALGGSPIPYGYFWWTARTPDGIRDHAFEALGIFGQHLYINPTAGVVIVIWSAQTTPTGGAAYPGVAIF